MREKRRQLSSHTNATCSECGHRFWAYKSGVFGRKIETCSLECARARKTRRQRERRAAAAVASKRPVRQCGRNVA